MRACRQCLEAGYEIAPGAVFSGPAPAPLMLVGQAPGRHRGRGQAALQRLVGHAPVPVAGRGGIRGGRFPRPLLYDRRDQVLSGQASPGQGRPQTDPRRATALPALPGAGTGPGPAPGAAGSGRPGDRDPVGPESCGWTEAVGRVFEVDGRKVLPLPHLVGGQPVAQPAPASGAARASAGPVARATGAACYRSNAAFERRRSVHGNPSHRRGHPDHRGSN